ncbi:GNAT family N-acetyltransferase [Candidatus Dependentiae bacterium]|nr:GNAT family N-acetyltransferase [Candidatus Dependentiae bacterium]
MAIRRFQSTDLPAIIALFRSTVHTINAKDYTPEELLAWAPQDLDETAWAQSLTKNYTIVAEHNGIIVGFGDLTYTGIINRLYVHKDYQSQTFGYRILEHLIAQAHRSGITEITAAVSITALPFALKCGAEIVQEQSVVRHGIPLTNFLVRKKL